MPTDIGLPQRLRDAWRDHESEARAALLTLQNMAPNLPPVPGCDTASRLAHRIACGRSIEGAAAREYLYRWNLAVDALASHASRLGSRPNPFAAHYAPHGLGL